MDPPFDGRILRRKSKGIPTHRVKHVVTAHPPITGHHITDGIVTHVAHVDASGGIGEHLKHIVLGFSRILCNLECFVVLPSSLPLLFYDLGLIPIFHVLKSYCNLAPLE